MDFPRELCYNQANDQPERMHLNMKFFDLPLDVASSGKGDYTAHMTVYAPSNGLDLEINRSRPAVVIFPGGGYGITYDGEAEPIALKFTAAGAVAVIVWYSVTGHCPEHPPRFPQALVEGLTAVRWVREHAAELGVNPDNIATLGFSAGGHLCACTGTLWSHACLAPYLDADRKLYRPDKLILCYPVITAFGPHHQGSFDNLLGNGETVQTPELLELVSLERQVADDTPPSFIWHTFSDPAVPVIGSLKFAQALFEHHVACEMHLYPQGGHGLCLASHTTSDAFPVDAPFYAADWMEHAVHFLFDEAIR